MQCKDQRIKLTTDVFNGIKALKLYTWEEAFQIIVEKIRDKELFLLQKAAYIHARSTFLWQGAPFLVSNIVGI